MEQKSTNTSLFAALDWPTIIIYLIMVIYGVVSIYAASYNFDHASIFSMQESSGKQMMWIGIALVVAVVLLLIEERVYETYAFPIYLVAILCLILTIFIAPDIKGSRSWIRLSSSLSIQPAEFAKFATALALAKLFSTYGFRLDWRSDRGGYLRALAIVLIPLLLIIVQKETGTALVFLSFFFVLYREGMTGLVLLIALSAVVIVVVALKFSMVVFMGIPLGYAIVFMLIMAGMVVLIGKYGHSYETARMILLAFVVSAIVAGGSALAGYVINGYLYFFTMIGGAAIYAVVQMLRGRASTHTPRVIGAVVAAILLMFSVDFAFQVALKPYQQERILVTLGTIEDPRGKGYNVNQSIIAIGSGGLTGKGFLNGTQTKLDYVPEQHTDFIFCTIGEEQGFLGCSLVLLLMLGLIFRMFTLAERQPTPFGRVYCYSVGCIFATHLMINVGMVLGLCPVIGIPLPFFSYGGSSMLSFTMLLFIGLRIDASRHGHLSA